MLFEFFPNSEDDGAIPLANATPLGPGARDTAITQAFLGDGPYGGTSGDFDWYKIDAAAGDVITAEVYSANIGFSLDSRLCVYDASGNMVANYDDWDAPDPLVSYSVATAGSYYIQVSSYNTSQSDPFDSASGDGINYLGDYQLLVNINSAVILPVLPSGDDTITGTQTPNLINGAAGDDTIQGGADRDVLDGGAGSDTVFGNGGDDIFVWTWDSAGQNDYYEFGEGGYGTALLSGTNGGDMVLHDNVLSMTSGNTLTIDGASDLTDVVLYGGDAGYTLDTSDASVVGTDISYYINGGDGADTIYGNAAYNEIYGGDGDDTITTGNFDVILRNFELVRGGGGNDTIQAHTNGNYWGDGGDDRMISYDTGDDDGNFMVVQYRYTDASTGIYANLTSDSRGGLAGGDNVNGFRISDGEGGVDLISNFVAVSGTDFNDIFRVDSTYTSLYGSWLQIQPNGGNDSIVFTGVANGVVAYTSAPGAVFADLQARYATDLNASDDFIGYDTFSGQAVFRATRFNDIVYGANGDDVMIRGELGDDTLYGRAGDDLLDGDDRTGNPSFTSNDTLIGGAGNDTLDGNNGDDTADYGQEGGPNGVYVDLRSGFATDSFGDFDTLIEIENLKGTDFADTLYGTNGSNTLEGGGGDDHIVAGAGSDTLIGGAGDDSELAGAGNDIFRADLDAGDDFFNGGAATDRLALNQTTTGVTVNMMAGTAVGSETGNDTFTGIENIVGGTGGDVFTPNAEVNQIHGNDGIDTLDFSSLSTQVNINLQANVYAGVVAAGDTYISIENVIGGDGDDSLAGDQGSNRLVGNAGNDTLQGRVGADVLQGGAGDDRLYGGYDDDLMIGGGGADLYNGGAGAGDTISYGGSSRVSVSLKDHAASSGDAVGDTFTGVENLSGGYGDDYFVGDTVANRIDGALGNDTIYGWTGDDTLVGGAGNDRLFGGGGTDMIRGDAGDDELWGNGDADIFVFASDFGVDRIADFQNGSDTINLTEVYDIADYSDVQSMLGFNGSGEAVITDGSDVLTVHGLTNANIDASDFVFTAFV